MANNSILLMNVSGTNSDLLTASGTMDLAGTLMTNGTSFTTGTWVTFLDATTIIGGASINLTWSGHTGYTPSDQTIPDGLGEYYYQIERSS